MAGTTDIVGWPYPSASDLIAQGAAKIEELAEAIEGQFFLTPNKFTAAQAFTSFPLGMSMMWTNNTDAGFPFPQGQVITYRQNNVVAHQWFYTYRLASEDRRVFLRMGYMSGGSPVWSPWQVVASPGTSEEEATGSVTMTPTAGTPTPINITFPTGRFSKNPRVFLQYQGTQPQDVSLSTDNRTPTGFRAYVYRPGATPVNFHYYAVVMASDIVDN